MMTSNRKAGILTNLDHCILFCGGTLTNDSATQGDRILAALTIVIASIGSAYIQSLETSHIMTAGRN